MFQLEFGIEKFIWDQFSKSFIISLKGGRVPALSSKCKIDQADFVKIEINTNVFHQNAKPKRQKINDLGI